MEIPMSDTKICIDVLVIMDLLHEVPISYLVKELKNRGLKVE